MRLYYIDSRTKVINVTVAVLEIVFESVQQKHLDKTIFDQRIVNFVQKTNIVPFMAYEIYTVEVTH